jgi:hypothetical protein
MTNKDLLSFNHNKMFTKVKDIDLIILNKLNDEDLLNICKMKNKYIQSLCKNEYFWRNRFIKNFGNTVEKTKERSWRNFYLVILFYSKYVVNRALIEATKGGVKNIDLINYFILKGAKIWNTGMRKAAKKGHRDLVIFFIEKGAFSWNRAMFSAAKGGHRDLVDFFIDQGANFWNLGMFSAAKGGHRDLVDFFIEKGAKNWNTGMFYAAKGGHRDLVDFFIDQGAEDWELGMRCENEDLVNFFKQKMNEYRFKRVIRNHL